MYRPSKILGVLSLGCLLATQASGLHLHVDEAGHHAGLHSAHTHQAHRADHDNHDYHKSGSHQGDLHPHPSSDHDHTQESDVSLFEELNSNAFSDPGSAELDHQTPPLPGPTWTQVQSRAPPDVLLYDRSCIHWRPPLRAPPLS